MSLNPDVQKKAQEELDLVLGGTLPSFADQDSLPYTSALVKEVFRWYPVTSLGRSLHILQLSAQMICTHMAPPSGPTCLDRGRCLRGYVHTSRGYGAALLP